MKTLLFILMNLVLCFFELLIGFIIHDEMGRF